MALDYSVFSATDQKSERPKSQNFFTYNPHLKFLIQRYEGNDPELTLDILNMIGELSAQETGLILGITPGGVRAIARDARHRLRAAYSCR